MVTSLLDVVNRVSNHQPRPFIAPIPDADTVEVFTLQDSIPYRFRLRRAEPGWWLLAPNDNRVHVSRPAHAHEYLQYLDYLPRFYAIACYRVAEGVWLVVPFNASDASQRGWRDGSPRLVHLVRESVRPFDVIDVRSMAGTLLYNTVAGLEIHNTMQCRQALEDAVIAQNVNVNWMNAALLVEERRKELYRLSEEGRREAAKRALEAQRRTLEDRIRFDAEFVGAELVSITDAGDDLNVTWTYDGYTHTSRINRQGRLESAGICLGDYRSEYEWHNMSTLILAIQEARGLHHHLPREAWL